MNAANRVGVIYSDEVDADSVLANDIMEAVVQRVSDAYVANN